MAPIPDTTKDRIARLLASGVAQEVAGASVRPTVAARTIRKWLSAADPAFAATVERYRAEGTADDRSAREILTGAPRGPPISREQLAAATKLAELDARDRAMQATGEGATL